MFQDYIAEHKVKDSRSQTKVKKDIVQKDNPKAKFVKCKKCEYETKKKATLKKTWLQTMKIMSAKNAMESFQVLWS